MKTHTRALRRHHRARVKKKRLAQKIGYFSLLKPEEVLHPKQIDTPKTCSCFLCGNPRKYVGELSYQEKRHADDDY